MVRIGRMGKVVQSVAQFMDAAIENFSKSWAYLIGLHTSLNTFLKIYPTIKQKISPLIV